jgi:hypothetical protein
MASVMPASAIPQSWGMQSTRGGGRGRGAGRPAPGASSREVLAAAAGRSSARRWMDENVEIAFQAYMNAAAAEARGGSTGTAGAAPDSTGTAGAVGGAGSAGAARAPNVGPLPVRPCGYVDVRLQPPAGRGGGIGGRGDFRAQPPPAGGIGPPVDPPKGRGRGKGDFKGKGKGSDASKGKGKGGYGRGAYGGRYRDGPYGPFADI